MFDGAAVSCAVGAGPESGGAVPGPLDVFFLLQPAKPTTAKSKIRQVRMRFLGLNLFSPYTNFSSLYLPYKSQERAPGRSYFQLQFGIESLPECVSCCCSVPSASIVQSSDS